LSSLCLQRQITDFHVLIQRLYFKLQQVQLEIGFSRTLPNQKDCIKFIRLIIYDELSLLPFIWGSFFWPSPKIVRSVASLVGKRYFCQQWTSHGQVWTVFVSVCDSLQNCNTKLYCNTQLSAGRVDKIVACLSLPHTRETCSQLNVSNGS
jgi:hypothetical protein